MNHFWERQLGDIREQLLLMCGLTERSLVTALRALLERDDKLCDSVELEDSQIDSLEVHIDELVITYIATHGPVAKDCRFMLAASKISSNLERIADQATKIARQARELNRQPVLKVLIDIPEMAQIGQEMLRESMTAYIESKPELAVEIIRRDKQVNALYRKFSQELIEDMSQDPRAITRALSLLTIAKALERVADHVTNIAEEVFYLYKGEDIRHERGLKGRLSKDEG